MHTMTPFRGSYALAWPLCTRSIASSNWWGDQFDRFLPLHTRLWIRIVCSGPVKADFITHLSGAGNGLKIYIASRTATRMSRPCIKLRNLNASNELEWFWDAAGGVSLEY